jgi:hypothetical protein
MFANIFRESTLTFRQVDVRFLTADIAITHAGWTMTGAHMPPGAAPAARRIADSDSSEAQWQMVDRRVPQHELRAAAGNGRRREVDVAPGAPDLSG